MFGSHNSWTFRTPIKWYLKPLYFLAQCQEVDIQTQMKDYNISLFDLRVKFINNEPYIHHGLFNYGKVDYADLKLLNDNNCYLRVMLESNSKMKDQILQEQQFITFCNELTQKYPNIKFFGGNRKFDGKGVYNFNTLQQPTLIDLYSSVTTLFDSDNKYLRILDDWFPRLYALLKNKKNLKEYVDTEDTEDTYLFYDFVNIN